MAQAKTIFWFLCYGCISGMFFSPHYVAGITQDSTAEFVEAKNLPLWSDTWEDKLKQNLFVRYDKFARPSQHWNITRVNFKLSVQTINVDDVTSVVALNLWSVMTWNDTKLKWNSSEYGGLKQINVGSHEVWIPDIHVLNSAAHGTEHYGDRLVMVNENGTVKWSVPAIYHFYCHMDSTYWPFEKASCFLDLASWTYKGDQVDIQLWEGSKEDNFYLDSYESTGEWSIQNVTSDRRFFYKSTTPYIYLTFKLVRASDLYYHVVFLPLLPIVFLTLLTFWLRPNSDLRLTINTAVIFIIVLFIIYFGFKVPPRCDSMPLIVRFYSGCLYLSSLSLIISTLLMNINKLACYFAIPRSVRSFLMGDMGRYLGIGHIIDQIKSEKSMLIEDMEEDPPVIIHMASSSSSNDEQLIPRVKSQADSLEWKLVATVVDRLFFSIYCFIFTSMAFIFLHGKKNW